MPAGLEQARIERFQAAAATHVGAERVPGLVALLARGEDVHVEAVGQLALGGRDVARDSLFRISSMTKPLTAAVTLALVDEGLISLDGAIDELIPELSERRVLHRIDGPLEATTAAWRPITVRDLLTFTFGFGMALEMFMSDEPWPIVRAEAALRLATLGPPDPSVQPDPDTWIANLGTLPLMAQPGERWLYNTGASVLGVLIARAAGEPFADVLRTRLLQPLGMRDTAFWTSDTERLATAYLPAAGGLEVWDPPAGVWSRRPAFCDGGAGLLSTVVDLFAFSRMMLAGGAALLSGELVAQMTSDQLTLEQKRRGGLGRNFFERRSWGFCQAVYEDGCFGWDGGLGSSWLMDPREDLCVIVLTQRLFETADAPQVHRDIQAAARGRSA